MKTFPSIAASSSAGLRDGAIGKWRDALDRWFYFCMSCLILLLVGYGFGRGLGARLLHPIAPLPWILHVHVLVFGGWVILFFVQSAVVRRHKVRLHRQLGMLGAGLGAALPVLGVATALVMRQWHASRGAVNDAFLAVSFNDMLTFAVAFGLALRWRRRPDVHRRLMLIASCALTVAAFARFPRALVPANSWYAAVDVLIGLGLLRDLIVERRVHWIYLAGLPAVMAGQLLALYLALTAPKAWLALLHACLD